MSIKDNYVKINQEKPTPELDKLSLNTTTNTPDFNNSIGNCEVNLHSPNLSVNDDLNYKIIVYGNDIKQESPVRMGGVFTFFFHRGEPLIVIGQKSNIPFFLLYSNLILLFF